MNFTNKIAYCKIEFPNVEEVDFTKDLNIPVIFESVLDETLDTCTIRLSDLRRKDYPSVDVSKAFEPDSVVRIGFEGQQTEIRMRIAHDDTKMQRKDDTPWRSWTHVLQLIEETKHTERESVDTLTFTNPIPRKYDSKANASWDVLESYYTIGGGSKHYDKVPDDIDWKPPAIMQVQQSNILEINDNASLMESNSDYVTCFQYSLVLYVTSPSGATTEYIHSNKNSKGNYTDEVFTIKLDESGEYILKFILEFGLQSYGGSRPNNYTMTYQTYITTSNVTQISAYTLADVINRILNLTPLKKKGEANRYKFDAEQLAEFAKEEAPEFAFTGHTLFEALLMVAQYKGSFPYLKGDTISFRPLWNGKTLTAADLPPANEEVNSSDINQYCTYIESEVQNLVGINNSREATVIEPYAGGYKTTRSNAGSEISEDTAVIPTDYNMYQSIALKMGYTNGKDVGDITPYVYEEGEYNGLSDTSGAYLNSKAYAIKWQQMGRNYTELAHRINHASKLENAFERPAISNVLYAKTGEKDDNSLMTYIKQLIDPEDKKDTFAELMFRTEYIPIFNARIKQYKDYFGDFHHDGSIKYNQTAELVDSEMYGEHLKSLIRKIGNHTKRAVYTFDKIDDVPEVGTVVDGYSVYDVAMRIFENKVVATICFVKYAELSQYIGVKNPWKDSDVSINKCYNRAISYNEFLLCTHDANKKSTSLLTLSSSALKGLVTFNNPSPLTCAQATGYTADGTAISTVLLPVIPLAIGNSLFFQWGYQDNYSAGYMSEKAPDGSTNALSGTKYHRAQKAVRYCDMYGRLDSLSYYLMPSGPSADDQATMRQIAYSLPKFPEIENWAWGGTPYVRANRLLIDKNSSEALTISTQFHYCTDNENFIIGSGLTNFCSLIGGAAEEIGLYGFNDRLNIFKRRFSVVNATKLTDAVSNFNADNSGIEISLPSAINNYKAWALMGKDKNGNWQIIFGENRDLNGSAFSTELFILPMRKLEDFI